MPDPCSHFGELRDVTPSGTDCKECLEAGDIWIHLRLCMSCGHVGCCDSSRNRHASKHFQATHHPVVRSLQRGETWLWCYADQVMLEPE